MSKKNCLAVASTPLHVLYIIEFVVQNNIFEVDLIVLIKRETDRPQILKIIDEFHWKSVSWLSADYKLANKFITIYELIFSMRWNPGCNYSYGVFADYGRTILSNVSCNQYFWLGDGTKLLYELSLHGGDVKVKENLIEGLEFFVRFFLKRNISIPVVEKIFTPFRLAGRNIEVNNFSWLKDKYKEIVVKNIPENENKVYFFGAYFCEVDGKELMCQSTYLELISRISKYYKSKNMSVIYVPHRHELKEKVNTISRLSNLTVVEFEFPAEYQFIYSGVQPTSVASFCSTAIYHFKYLGCVENIESFYVDFSKYGSRQVDRMEVYYQYLRELIGSENVIDLDLIEGV